ncbi:MAG: hypothetical protein Q9169_002028 [Polycauliona sp. 2 TL-2023]
MHRSISFVLLLSSLSSLIITSLCLHIPPPAQISTSAGVDLHVRDDTSSPISRRAILPGAPRSYVRVLVRRLAMIVPAPLNTNYWRPPGQTFDGNVYAIVANFFSKILLGLNGLQIGGDDPAPAPWYNSPPEQGFYFTKGHLRLTIIAQTGVVPWEFVDWFCNEMRHGSPALEGGGGYATFFQEFFRVPETGQIIAVAFGSIGGTWQDILGDPISRRPDLLGNPKPFTPLDPPGGLGT